MMERERSKVFSIATEKTSSPLEQEELKFTLKGALFLTRIRLVKFIEAFPGTIKHLFSFEEFRTNSTTPE